MKEIFKFVPGYEGKYMVSNLGNVLSLDYQNTKKPKMLSPVNHHGGYKIVHLGKTSIKMVHTLVATVFIPNPDKKKFVNHIDGNKHNNRATNLEWVTSKENMNHAIVTGLRDPHKNNHPKGANVVNSRAVLQFTKTGELVRRWECISDAAREIGCNPCLIINNVRGRTLTARGFVWKYPE